MTDLDSAPNADPLVEFGRELRTLRIEKGLTLEKLADRIGFSESLVGSVERATRTPSDDFTKRCEEALGLKPRHLAKLLPAGRRLPIFRTLAPWMDIERQARELWTWEPLVVPGLLQTEGYARAILSAKPGSKEDRVDEAVQARMARQAIFRRDEPPGLWAVLDEGILYRPVGSESVTRDQLTHLIEMSQSRWITIQILPFSALSTLGLLGGFVIAITRDMPDAAFVDSPVIGRVWDQQPEVEVLKYKYQVVRSEALPQSLSLEKIKKRLEQKWTW
ncbi:helix-turn-helix domain-containing protein [Nonomuraea glycinis]|uniref:helix-turn-helix domain-containing protein n=1 Tax=Nonomuraea glycinis TaxID=2047744 RepID=UPI00339F935D